MREHTKNLFAPNLTKISICPKNSLRDLDEDLYIYIYIYLFIYKKDEQ